MTPPASVIQHAARGSAGRATQKRTSSGRSGRVATDGPAPRSGRRSASKTAAPRQKVTGDQPAHGSEADGPAPTITIGHPVTAADEVLDPDTRAFYCKAMHVLLEAKVPFLIGGAYAFERYTGIARHTKDLDVFVRERDVERTLDAFAKHGCRTEVTFPHWLGKAYCGDHFVDVIFSSGNGMAAVDEEWFEYALEEKVLGVPVKIMPAEEMIWQKALIMERERFDGADVAHLFRARGPELDWPRLLRRFDAHWRVLLAHVILFGYIYPDERDKVPAWVMGKLLGRMATELGEEPPEAGVCNGTVLSRSQYVVDVERWGYKDARVEPLGQMTSQEAAAWTEAGRTTP